MRIFISACGEGFGHTSRMIALYREFEKRGHEITISCYGSSLERLKGFGLNTFETSPEAHMVGKQGRFDLARSIIATSRSSTDIINSYVKERRFVQSSKIDAVVSDSRLSTALVGTHLGKPTFLVANQTSYAKAVEEGEKGLGHRLLDMRRINERVAGRLLEIPLTLPFAYCDAVLIPDFKPPNTICIKSLSDNLHIKKKTFFTGPMSTLLQKKTAIAPWETDKVKVLVTMGGQRFREGVLQNLVEGAGKLTEFEFIISSIFATKDIDNENVKIRRYLPDVLPYMNSADILVIPAGHSSIMESILLSKPSILIPDLEQFEQLDNAFKYREMGLGEVVSIDRLGQFQAKLKELNDNYGIYKRKLQGLARRADEGENGAKNGAVLVEEFYKRVNSY